MGLFFPVYVCVFVCVCVCVYVFVFVCVRGCTICGWCVSAWVGGLVGDGLLGGWMNGLVDVQFVFVYMVLYCNVYAGFKLILKVGLSRR